MPMTTETHGALIHGAPSPTNHKEPIMADEVKTKKVTIKRAVRLVSGGKIEKLKVNQTVDLPIPEANGLIAGNKAEAGEKKFQTPKKAEPKKV
jgi:hypothetical protein